MSFRPVRGCVGTEKSIVHGSDELCVVLGVEGSEIVIAGHSLVSIGRCLWNIDSNGFAHYTDRWYEAGPVAVKLAHKTVGTSLVQTAATKIRCCSS